MAKTVRKANTIAKQLVGKTIERVQLNPFRDGRGARTYNPIIIFDDGSSIYFHVVETESDYGIEMTMTKGY